MIDQSEELSRSKVQFITHFFGGAQLCCDVYQQPRGKLDEFGAEKPIFWAKPAPFDFFTINFTVWSHILGLGSGHMWKQRMFPVPENTQSKKATALLAGPLNKGMLNTYGQSLSHIYIYIYAWAHFYTRS